MGNMVTQEQVSEALKTVMDPEIGRDLVSLGMIKHVTIGDGEVTVEVELTTPACPMKSRIAADVREAVQRLPGVREVKVDFSARVRRGGAGSKSALPGVKHVVAVGAGKGGVGKSTLAVQLALMLQRSGAAVGLMDADVYGPSIPMMLGMGDMKPQMAGEQRILPIDANGIKVMSMGFLMPAEEAVIWRGPMVHSVVKQFLDNVDWGELDYLIVDLPPGTGDVPLTLSQAIPLTGAAIVCTGQDVARADARRAIKMYATLGVSCLGVIENMTYFVAPDTGREYDLFGKGGAATLAEECDVPFLGSVPLHVAIRTACDQGRSAGVLDQLDSATGDAIRGVAANLAGQVSIRAMAGSD